MAKSSNTNLYPHILELTLDFTLETNIGLYLLISTCKP